MSKESLLIYKVAGLSEESDWAQGTITAATKLLPLRDSGVVVGLAPNIIQPVRLAARAGLRETILGTISPSMTIPAFGYPVGVGLKLLKAGLGQVASTEQASFTVTTGANDKINFTEDGGSELTATLAAGTYVMGTSSATASTLCKEVKDKLEAAAGSAGTYTVSYSYTTKKMTIAVSGGASVFVLKFSTGADAALSARSLLGYGTVDTVSGASAVAGTATEIVFQHVISILDAIPYGLSKGLTAQIKLADSTVFDILDAVVNSLSIAYAPNQELHFDAELHARRVEASVATLSALTSPGANPLVFSQAAFTLAGGAVSLAGLGISFNNNYKTDLFINGRYRSKFVRGGFRTVTGSFTFDITDVNTYDLYDDFVADAAGVPLVATFTGPVIKGAQTYSMAFNMPLVKFSFDSVPGGGGMDAPAGEVPFIALDNGTDGELKITIQNNESEI
jgi:hypothetical protein